MLCTCICVLNACAYAVNNGAQLLTVDTATLDDAYGDEGLFGAKR